MGVSQEDVVAAYRLILGRADASPSDIAYHMAAHATVGEMRSAFLASEEFSGKERFDALPDAWVRADTGPNGAAIWLNLQDRFVSLPALRGTFEPAETAFLKRWIRPGDTVVDAGANIGWHTLVAAQACGVDGQVYAVEPRPDTAEFLSRTIAENQFGGSVTIIRAALTDRPGQARIAWRPSSGNPGNSWLEAKSAQPEAGLSYTEVPTLPLDDLAIRASVSMLKIDVEGGEPLVLAGASRTLARDKPIVLTEVFGDQLQRVSGVDAAAYTAQLSGFGYRIAFLEPDASLGWFDQDQLAHLPTDRPFSIVCFDPDNPRHPNL